MQHASDHVQRNAAELSRLRSLVERLSEADLVKPVNEAWTVAGVLAHIAFWDARAHFLAGKLLAGRPFTPDDDEPEDVDWINDSVRPLAHEIPPLRAAELALRIAQQTDARIAALPRELVARSWPSDPASPLNLVRAGHRGEHVDEIEAALGRG